MGTPLPKSDRNSQLQRRSIIFFQEFLPVELFVFRDERVDDAGVDGSLEILMDGCYTNMRAQVQLKSNEKKNSRKDGVVTLPIETSNFNYLLNGSLGLYVLYVEETRELFYAWATEENYRRIKISSDWRDQKDISIPLQEMNKFAIQNIYEKIRLQAELHRKILESLAHSPTNDNISIAINPNSLESENSVEVEALLISSGMTLVAIGYSNLVLKKLGLVSQKASTEARFKLIGAYANYSTGRYQSALGAVADAIISNELEEEDQRFAERIHLSCQTNLGIITTEQYFQEMDAIAKVDESLSIEIELQKLIDKSRSQIDRDEEISQQIQQIKERVTTSEIFSENLKLAVRIKHLEVMGFDAVREILSEIFKAGARRDSQIFVPLIDQALDLKKVFDGFEEWNKESSLLLEDANNANNKIFVADALSTKAFITLMGLISNIAFIEFEGLSLDLSIIQNEVLLILGWCEKAQNIYKQANMLEGEVRNQLIMAQAFEALGQLESAKNLAQGVISKAKSLGYKRHIKTANEIISGETLFSKRLQSVRETIRRKKADEYDSSVLETDKDIEDFTDFFMETYKIPQERRKHVEMESLCMRDIAREKTQWCQHINIHQNLTHTFSPTTLYAEDPNRRVICSKFDYYVDKSSPDWLELIKDFKATYCFNCSSREPTSDKDCVAKNG